MKVCTLILLSVAAVSATIHFKETFGDDSWSDRWVTSDFKKSEGSDGKWELSAGAFYGDAEADKGLKTSQDARFYATSASFPKFSNDGKDLVIQFSVKHAQKIDCGGGYVKVFPSTLDQPHMTGDSDYNIMFGPDICASNRRVHVIFNYKGKNLLRRDDIPCETDELTHVYTLIVKPDNTYSVKIDGEEKASGSLSDDWDFLLPKKINDPDQSKPSDWVDEAMMDDPEDTKPAGWDDITETIVDPEAEKPEDWDDEDDGEWEAPTIDNPEFKGEWTAKRIENPEYKGSWEHPQIDNPDFFDDDKLYSYEDFGVIGLDLWQVKSGSIFDNIIITDDVAEAAAFMAETTEKTRAGEKAMFEEQQKAADEAAAAERAKMEAEAEEEEEDDEEEEEEDEAPKKEEL